MSEEEERKPEEQAYIAHLLADCPETKSAQHRAREFVTLVRERTIDNLDQWLIKAVDSGLVEMRGFVAGLRCDLAAVRAALTSEWSNGHVEGQVNRLKLIKRQMYGHANFDLLRQRVLHAV